MAYKIDKNGMLVGDGLPDGVAINMDAYNRSISKYNSEKKAKSLYPLSYEQNSTKMGDSVTKFRLGRDGQVLAFVPEMRRKPVGMGNLTGEEQWQPIKSPSMYNLKGEVGSWIETTGLMLDESTKSGRVGQDFTIINEGGAPLAVFGKNAGYMRLATQRPKTADDLRLGNQSGTASGNVRQNAQRRTLL